MMAIVFLISTRLGVIAVAAAAPAGTFGALLDGVQLRSVVVGTLLILIGKLMLKVAYLLLSPELILLIPFLLFLALTFGLFLVVDLMRINCPRLRFLSLLRLGLSRLGRL